LYHQLAPNKSLVNNKQRGIDLQKDIKKRSAVKSQVVYTSSLDECLGARRMDTYTPFLF
jgi:hypothetical protein